MTNFEKWDKEFRSQNLFAFNSNENALMWLKVRAVCRGKQIQQFLENSGITLTSSKIAEQNVELFEMLETMPNAMQLLDAFLNERNHEWYNTVKDYLDNFNEDSLKEINFKFKGNQYKSLADVIFVVK